MLFGEIIEPSTRALILDDELEELPEYKEPVFEWEGDSLPPDDIEALVFVESKKVLQVCSFISNEMKLVAKLKDEGVSIYKSNKNYLVQYDGNNKNLVIGEIVGLLSAWIMRAKSVHGITSNLISSFQPIENLPKSSPITFTRCLTNLDKVPYNFCKRLEAPNLIKDLGATVLTYCIHSNLKATLWVIYTDLMPLDSVNSSEIVNLLKKLGFEVAVQFRNNISDSNLYM